MVSAASHRIEIARSATRPEKREKDEENETEQKNEEDELIEEEEGEGQRGIVRREGKTSSKIERVELDEYWIRFHRY